MSSLPDALDSRMGQNSVSDEFTPERVGSNTPFFDRFKLYWLTSSSRATCRCVLPLWIIRSIARRLNSSPYLRAISLLRLQLCFLCLSSGHAIKPIRSISFMRIKMAGDKTKRRLQKLRFNASPAHCYSQRFSCFASGEAHGPRACTIASSPTSCVAQE
jgi:hypothetical protein